MWESKKDKEIFERIHDVEVKQSMMQNNLDGDERKFKELHDYTVFLLKHNEIKFEKYNGIWSSGTDKYLLVKVNEYNVARIFYNFDYVYSNNNRNISYRDSKVEFLNNYEPEGKSFKKKMENYDKLKSQLERFKEFIVQDFAE